MISKCEWHDYAGYLQPGCGVIMMSPGTEGLKRLNHPQIGTTALEFTTFSVEGRPDLTMMVFNPATDESRMNIERWITQNRAHREG